MIKLIVGSLIIVAAVYVGFPFEVEPLGVTKVERESVCTRTYAVGAGGTSRRICDQWKTVDVTYSLYRFSNRLEFTWEGWGK